MINEMFAITTKRTVLFLALCAAILSMALVGTPYASTDSGTPTEEEAKSFVEHLIGEGMYIANKAGNNQSEFGALLEKNFVTEAIANFVLGVHGRKFTPEQKARFWKLFAKRLVKIYSTRERIETFENTTHTIESARVQNDRTMQVNTSFSFNNKPGAQPVKVYWKVVKKDGKVYVYDILFEGISQLLALRSEYGSLFTGAGGSDPERFLRYLEGLVGGEE